MYECVLAYYYHLQRSLCWLRLFDSPVGTVAILSEVPGNPGPEVRASVEEAARVLVERFALDPQALTIVEQTLPPADGTGKSEFHLVLLHWEKGARGIVALAPSRQHVDQLAVETVVLGKVATLPFWRRSDDRRSMICAVGARRGAVWRSAPLSAWSAMVTDERGDQSERGFEYTWEAQAWVLNHLTMLAGEFDELPPWLRHP